jgi:hypothetical protein
LSIARIGTNAPPEVKGSVRALDSERAASHRFAAMWKRACVVLVLSACGSAPRPAPSPPPPGDPCIEDRQSAAAASEALEVCLSHASPPTWSAREKFDRIEAELNVLLLRGQSGEPSSFLESQALAEKIWDMLDELEHAPAGRERLEYAAEAILHQGDADERQRALTGLAVALGAVRGELEPVQVVACETERSLALERADAVRRCDTQPR